MFKIKNKIVLNLILIFAIFALLFAYYVEYILNHKPCNLCLIERIPYIFTIIFITLNLIIKKFEKFILITLSLIFISATFLSFYHFGIEQGFIKESLVCDLNNKNLNLSKEDLLKTLQKSTISCKDVTFRILGFSLATLNTITSLILSIITIKLYRNYEKNKQN
jgi:disulfide bond formation protein DsbB|tara:strand:- start:19106 stop:19597 length:492 start_codon:yes stop_codon:yes gene_type:complete